MDNYIPYKAVRLSACVGQKTTRDGRITKSLLIVNYYDKESNAIHQAKISESLYVLNAIRRGKEYAKKHNIPFFSPTEY